MTSSTNSKMPSNSRRMRFATAAITSLALLTACGGGDGGGGKQGDVADALMASAEEDDIALDEECVKEVSAKLSDDDAQLLLDSLDSDEEPTLSADGEALKGEIFGCIDPGALVDQMMESIGDQPGMDKDCVREVFDGLTSDDIAEIAQSEGDPSGDVMAQVMEDILPCMSAGG